MTNLTGTKNEGRLHLRMQAAFAIRALIGRAHQRPFAHIEYICIQSPAAFVVCAINGGTDAFQGA
ncbi:hypothetical protein ACIHDR_30595 [Nocardia sp. NPDC052278]|uniref:hypothetical protein n=1 Tax=unclassified Nocardia TaxID=2637762 RepID=UPI0036AE3125